MIKTINIYFDKLISVMLFILVILMCFLSLASIMARPLQLGQDWIDPLVRHMVLFSAFLGATLSISSREHISMDILRRLLIKKGKSQVENYLNIFNLFVSFMVSILLFHSGLKLYLMESAYEKDGLLGLSSSYLVSVVPLGMGILSLKFFIFFLEQIFNKERALK